jgi:hypothetical protein
MCSPWSSMEARGGARIGGGCGGGGGRRVERGGEIDGGGKAEAFLTGEREAGRGTGDGASMGGGRTGEGGSGTVRPDPSRGERAGAKQRPHTTGGVERPKAAQTGTPKARASAYRTGKESDGGKDRETEGRRAVSGEGAKEESQRLGAPGAPGRAPCGDDVTARERVERRRVKWASSTSALAAAKAPTSCGAWKLGRGEGNPR